MGKRRKWPWTKQESPRPEVAELEESLQNTRVLIAQAYAGFNAARDSELVESYVYEIQALQARYSYLLRRRKALSGEPSMPPSSRPAQAAPVA